MNDLVKGRVTVDGNELHVSMPFEKVDVKKRTVSGYATLDNIDSQGDVVLAEASKKAFERARGNLREMHKKDDAVGRIIDFREDEFFNADDGKLYRGIFVTARVSEGAPNTWLKVLDGTLSGFSIGGEINEASNEFVKDAGRTVRFIKDYDLTELSLVDNPANQLANVTAFQKVFSFEKSETGSVTVTGMVADTKIENVFICTDDDTVVVKDDSEALCPRCGTSMELAGWFESGDNRDEKVKEVVNKFRNPSETEAPTDEEGGVEKMAKKDEDPTTKPVDLVNPGEEFPPGSGIKADVNAAPVEDEEAEVDETAGTDEEEETETPEEVHDDESNIEKKIDELHEAVKESLQKTADETKEQVLALEKKIDEVNESLTKKASDLEDRFNEVGTKIEAQKSRVAELEHSLEKMNASGAFKKSADFEEEKPAEKSEQRNGWNGAFSGKKFSVDNQL